ncbi:MAG TPA: translation initiation factor [Vicinamibacterales bacterium]|nr:translation initiation factor [Vicinamibacterales bacterium]
MSDKFNNPFAALAPLGSGTPDHPAAQEDEKPKAPAEPPRLPPGTRAIPRAVVRMERSGRGGKEVTVIEQLDLGPLDREKWLKQLKAALGCGGVVEGNTLVLQGDHRNRLPAVLTARGVKRVTIG